MMDPEANTKRALRSFERKVLFAKVSRVLEQLWLRAWWLFGLAGVFLVVSYFDVWSQLNFVPHVALLGFFGLGVFAVLVSIGSIRWPSRDDAIAEIERASDVPHRPASSYEDTLTGGAGKAETSAIWAAHQKRMLSFLSVLKPSWPNPRTERRDPYALRVLGLLCLGVFTGFMGHLANERVASAFDFSQSARFADTRLDVWITPPTYTERVPVMLANGSPDAGADADESERTPPSVPEKSALVVRASGLGDQTLYVEIGPIEPEPTSAADADGRVVNRIVGTADAGGVGADTGQRGAQEARVELIEPSTIRVLAGARELASWMVDVTPDLPPTISLSRPPQLTPRGSLKITYRADDDYGVASGEMSLVRDEPDSKTDKDAWARLKRPIGPRPLLTRLPKLALKIPQKNAKEVSHHTYFSLESHPWAGQDVLMTLKVVDVAGKTGQSQPFRMRLPERQFNKPLARAVAEQRKLLLDDLRYWKIVRKSLAALTLEPEDDFDDLGVYLGLRSVYHRLDTDRSRAGFKSSIDQLWHIALRIEDGDLSDAEQRLRQARERLEKALEDGASEEELKALMNELKQAMNDFMRQLAQQGQQQQNGQSQDQQSLAQEDLERMMQNLEDMANSGAREQAQQMLSEMQDLMERMQAGAMNQEQQRQNQEMMKMLEELGEMVGEQQSLMDDTFDERRGGQQQQRGQQRMPSQMRGMGEDGQQDQRGASPGQNGQGQRGQAGQRGQGGRGRAQAGQGLGQGKSLAQRQQELRERIRELQERMQQQGRGGSGDEAGERLGGAESAMRAAEEALQDGDLSGATEEQGQALEDMRQSAQSMAQQMMQNSPSRYGRGGDSARDPLGRPQRSKGPVAGTSVKVPEEIDTQRAREILQELRRRLGDATRSPQEMDYLERLLKRF